MGLMEWLLFGGAGVLALGFLYEAAFNDDRPLTIVTDLLLMVVVMAIISVFAYSILTG